MRGLQLLDDLIAYIEDFRRRVVDGADGNRITQIEKSRIVAAIKQDYHNYRQNWWVPICVDAMAREMNIEIVA